MHKITYLFVVLFVLHFNALKALEHTQSSHTQLNEIQRVRISFTMPTGYTRHLLLAFTPDNAATDGLDFGYDATINQNLPDDLNWMLNEHHLIIQGVDAFDDSKFYALGMFLSNAGTIAINLTALENFDEPINVYIYDALLNTYTVINEFSYTNIMEAGTYLNRFYLSFKNVFPANIEAIVLSNEYFFKDTWDIRYVKNTNMIAINTNKTTTFNRIDIYNMLGQKVLSKWFTNQISTEISLHGIKSDLLIVKISSPHLTQSKTIAIY